MPRSRQNRKVRPRSNANVPQNPQVNILKQILDLQKTQQNQSIETVRDVPMMILKRDKVYTFTRKTALSYLQATNTGAGASFAFSLNLLPSGSDFTNLFEQYRVKQLIYQFTPIVGLGSGAVDHSPLITWFDYDDNVVPIGASESYQTQTTRTTPQGQFVQRVVTPQLSQDGLATGSATTAYSAPPNNLWIDDAYPNALYYGLKTWIPASGQTEGAPLWAATVTAVIQCRRPK
jgi:hypothetical protein